MNPITFQYLADKKKTSDPLVMVTAYEYSLASVLDQSDVDLILVGDSLANVALGLESTRDVTLEMMVYHCQAVSRGVKRAMVIGDMPYEAYQLNPKAAVDNAKKIISEGGVKAVKLEWFDQCLDVVADLRAADIAVMGHIGLTPQRVDELGGYKVQGKSFPEAKQLWQQAQSLQELGCFALVLECVPAVLAQGMSQRLSIPTIGIGAGNGCDGQVLVTQDLLGLSTKFRPKFVKNFTSLTEEIQNAVKNFSCDVKTRKFPDAQHSYSMNEDQLEGVFSE
jgi:3-methyl-2-oxobutanoate hydroxymethyltransferase